jgi:hypothetical protein
MSSYIYKFKQKLYMIAGETKKFVAYKKGHGCKEHAYKTVVEPLHVVIGTILCVKQRVLTAA